LELLEKRANRIKAFTHLWSRLYGDSQGWRIVKDETQKRVSNQPFAPVGHEKIEAGQMRQLHLPVLVAHREIIQAAVIEVSDTGKTHTVAVNGRPRHHSDFRTPRSIVRGRNGEPP